ncbi:hypothetical protein QBC39DRAFT_6239 [Podospora conica]|nr:hypothetical protein QBC39DRAFT_6239 [Schizothecium conicum]
MEQLALDNPNVSDGRPSQKGHVVVVRSRNVEVVVVGGTKADPERTGTWNPSAAAAPIPFDPHSASAGVGEIQRPGPRRFSSFYILWEVPQDLDSNSLSNHAYHLIDTSRMDSGRTRAVSPFEPLLCEGLSKPLASGSDLFHNLTATTWPEARQSCQQLQSGTPRMQSTYYAIQGVLFINSQCHQTGNEQPRAGDESGRDRGMPTRSCRRGFCYIPDIPKAPWATHT